MTDPEKSAVKGATPLQVENPAQSAFRNVVGFHLRLAQEASFQTFERAAGKAGLKPGWYAALTVLARYDVLTPSELSLVCGRDRSTLTSTLKGLSALGLIERQQKPGDQRSYTVRLTAEGRKMQERLQHIALEHDRHLDQILGDDKAAFLEMLKRIVEALGDS